MREILFRGKRIDNGEWVIGSFWENCGCPTIIPAASIVGFHVDPETVGQYTGMTDKNGKKIFEGDVVKSVFNKRPYVVCFGEYTHTDEYGNDESVFGWYNIEKGGYITAFGAPDAWATAIGNIHDNPELLEEVKC